MAIILADAWVTSLLDHLATEGRVDPLTDTEWADYVLISQVRRLQSVSHVPNKYLSRAECVFVT